MGWTYLLASLAESKGFHIIGVVARLLQTVLDGPQEGLDVLVGSVANALLEILLEELEKWLNLVLQGTEVVGRVVEDCHNVSLE